MPEFTNAYPSCPSETASLDQFLGGRSNDGGAWDAGGVQGGSEDDGKEVEAAGSGRAGGMEGSGPDEERTGKPGGDPAKEQPKMNFSALSTEETEEFLRLLYKGTATDDNGADGRVD